MFADRYKVQKTNPKTKEKYTEFNLWNELPVWRWRRPNEVVEGEVYDSPWVRIPKENVAISGKDVIFLLFQTKFYEQSARNETAFKYEIVGIVWLNTAEALGKMNIANLEPCDPLVATPMAGYYKGPLGWEGEPPVVTILCG